MNTAPQSDTFAEACSAAGGFPSLTPPPHGRGAVTSNLASGDAATGFAPRPLLGLSVASVLRPVQAIGLSSLTPGMSEGPAPEFAWVLPTDLKVDESYQRHLSERSLVLIRRIVTQWDWRRFKPPVVARMGDDLVVVDGQHTAIAAASHPDITQIPVMIVEAEQRADQARAFVGHNRDRLNITPMQLHFAAVASGDEDALTVDQVCERAGVRVLRYTPSGGVFRPGETVAVNAIAALVNRRGAQKARVVLQVLVAANAAPVAAKQIKAVEMLLHDAEYRDQVQPADLTAALLAMGMPTWDQEAFLFSTAHKVQLWRALGIILFRKARKSRRAA